MKNILLIKSTALNDKQINFLKKKFKKTCFIISNNNLDEINQKVKTANALINPPRKVLSKKFFKFSTNLEWIHIGGAGVEDFNTTDFKKSKIALTNGKIIQGPSVADHAIGLLLAITRNLHYYLKENTKDIPRPIELYNKIALIYGSGGIGSCVAERLKSFGMKNILINNELNYMHSFIDEFYMPDGLKKNISRANVVICCSPLTNKTKRIFDKNLFKKMKKGVVFINVSRGGLVDTKDLILCLKSGHFKGVGLDVTDPEPLKSENYLNKSKKVIITPHVAGPSDKNRQRSFELVIENINRFIRKETLLNLVNLKEGY